MHAQASNPELNRKISTWRRENDASSEEFILRCACLATHECAQNILWPDPSDPTYLNGDGESCEGLQSKPSQLFGKYSADVDGGLLSPPCRTEGTLRIHKGPDFVSRSATSQDRPLISLIGWLPR